MTTVWGIDPGYSGAVAYLSNVAGFVESIPLLGRELDEMKLTKILDDYEPQLVVMEKVHAMPGNGVASSFRFGQIYGQLISTIKLGCHRLELVAPQTWKAVILRDTKKDKRAALDYCARVYPDICLVPPGCRKPSHDFAEAICIAEYGRRVYL